MICRHRLSQSLRLSLSASFPPPSRPLSGLMSVIPWWFETYFLTEVHSLLFLTHGVKIKWSLWSLLPLCFSLLSLSHSVPLDIPLIAEMHPAIYKNQYWLVLTLIDINDFHPLLLLFSHFKPDARTHSTGPVQAPKKDLKMLPRQKTQFFSESTNIDLPYGALMTNWQHVFSLSSNLQCHWVACSVLLLW